MAVVEISTYEVSTIRRELRWELTRVWAAPLRRPLRIEEYMFAERRRDIPARTLVSTTWKPRGRS